MKRILFAFMLSLFFITTNSMDIDIKLSDFNNTSVIDIENSANFDELIFASCDQIAYRVFEVNYNGGQGQSHSDSLNAAEQNWKSCVENGNGGSTWTNVRNRILRAYPAPN